MTSDALSIRWVKYFESLARHFGFKNRGVNKTTWAQRRDDALDCASTPALILPITLGSTVTTSLMHQTATALLTIGLVQPPQIPISN